MAKKFILAALFLPLVAFAYFNPGKPAGFVNDYAGVLSGEQKQLLETKLAAFEKETSNEIAVATIMSLQGDTIENFAVQLFKDWGIGKKNNDNGVLLLIAKDDRQMRIEVGYGLEGALTDAQSYQIINDDLTPAFRQGDYYGGINKATDDIIAATKGEYASNSGAAPDGILVGMEAVVGRIFGLGWFVLFVFIFLASVLGRSKSWWLGGVLGGILGTAISILAGLVFTGLIALAVFVPLGLIFDFIVSRAYEKGKAAGHIPWWIGGRGPRGGSGGGGFGGFGGFGGGRSGGGGASGSW
jgi:uncharacterized protein